MLDCPELVAFLCPEIRQRDTNRAGDELPSDAQSDVFDRALKAEQRITEAVVRIGGKPAEALRILGGLDDGTMGFSLQLRRKLAGQMLGTKSRPVGAATFVKNYEPGLVRDLAVEVWRSQHV